MRKLLFIIVVGFLSTDLYSEDYIPGEPGDSSLIGNFWEYLITDAAGDTSFVKLTIYDFYMEIDPDCSVVPAPSYRIEQEYMNQGHESINTSNEFVLDTIDFYAYNDGPKIWLNSNIIKSPLQKYLPGVLWWGWEESALNDNSEEVIDTNLAMNGKTYSSVLRLSYNMGNDTLRMRNWFIDSLGLIRQEVELIDSATGELKEFQLELIGWETKYSKSTGIKPGTGNPAHNYNEKQLRGMNKTGAPVNILGRRIPGMDMNDKKAVNVIYDPEEGRLKQVLP